MHLGVWSVCMKLGGAWGSCGITHRIWDLTALLSQGFLHTLGLSECFVNSYFQKVRFLSELLPLSLLRLGVSGCPQGKVEKEKKGKKNEHFP